MAVNSFNAQNPPVTTKGDLFTFSTIPTRLGVGANNTVLTADSTTATGLKWATPAAAFVGCSVYQSSAQSVANDTWTNLTFGAEFFDTDGFHSTTTNTSRITIPTGKGGKYLFTATVTWNTSSTGDRTVTFAVTSGGTSQNGTRVPGVANNDSMINASAILDLTAGAYVECQVQQKSGGSLSTATGSSGNVVFSCVYLGA